MGALAYSGLPDRLGWLAALLVLGMLAAVGRPQAIGSIQVSVAGIVQIAAIPLIGPVGAGLVATVPLVLDRRAFVKSLFNASQRLLLVLAGAGAYHLAGGRELTSGLDQFHPVQFSFQLALAGITAGVVNTALLAGVLQRSSAASLRVIIGDLLHHVVLSYFGYAIAAFLLVLLWAPASLGWISVLFFLPSLFVIQWSLGQYATQWTTRHEVLAPFVVALDVRHPGAAEVSRLGEDAARAMATALALAPEAVDEVATAARVRDVGTLALEGTPPEIVCREHAVSARRVLGSVTFLDTTLETVAAHQERVDGSGCPDGLIGDQIPVAARIVAVADCWSREVAQGASAAEAVARCEEMAHRVLDAQCVGVLRRALTRGQLADPDSPPRHGRIPDPDPPPPSGRFPDPGAPPRPDPSPNRSESPGLADTP